MGRREHNQEARRRRIVEAAVALFHEKGFEAATTDEIAERADVAKGTLFFHARTKAGLLLLVFEAALRDAGQEAFRRMEGAPDPATALARGFETFFAVYEREPDLSRRFLQEQMFLAPEDGGRMAELTRDFLGALEQRVAAWQEQGLLAPDVPPGLAAMTSFGLDYSVVTAWLTGHLAGPHERDAMLRQRQLEEAGFERVRSESLIPGEAFRAFVARNP